MKNIKRISIILSLILVTFGISSCVNRGDKTEEYNNMENSNIKYDFALKDVKGNLVKLSDYSGKKVYIKFWASWCSICLAGLDEVNELADENKNFQVVTIVSPGANGEKSSEDFKKWYEGLDYNMIVLLDEGGKIASNYGVRAYPTSAIIDSKGALEKTIIGHSSNDKIKAILKDVK